MFVDGAAGFSPGDKGMECVSTDLPEFDFRRELLSRDPLAPVMAFTVAVRLILAELLGLRMCSRCPHCANQKN